MTDNKEDGVPAPLYRLNTGALRMYALEMPNGLVLLREGDSSMVFVPLESNQRSAWLERYTKQLPK